MSLGSLVTAVLPEPPSAGTAGANGTNCWWSCSTAQMAKPGSESCHVSSEVMLMGNGESGGCVSVPGCVYAGKPLLCELCVVCY